MTNAILKWLHVDKNRGGKNGRDMRHKFSRVMIAGKSVDIILGNQPFTPGKADCSF